MTTDSPAKVTKGHLLVLGAAFKIATGVELSGIRVHLLVHVNVVDLVGSKCTVGDHFVGAVDLDVVPTQVLAETAARHADADGLAQAQIDHGELGLPLFDGEVAQGVGDGLARVGAVLGNGSINLLADTGLPFGVLGQVDRDPGGVDATVDLTGEQGADDELSAVSVGVPNEPKKVPFQAWGNLRQ